VGVSSGKLGTKSFDEDDDEDKFVDNKTIATTNALTITIAITHNFQKSIRMYQGNGRASTIIWLFGCSWFSFSLTAMASGIS